ncbi:hypothetical protein AB8880_12765 [Alphaproteobacteria bacterium LSUCC0684]
MIGNRAGDDAPDPEKKPGPDPERLQPVAFAFDNGAHHESQRQKTEPDIGWCALNEKDERPEQPEDMKSPLPAGQLAECVPRVTDNRPERRQDAHLLRIGFKIGIEMGHHRHLLNQTLLLEGTETHHPHPGAGKVRSSHRRGNSRRKMNASTHPYCG